jgi:hypothetical protein
LVEGRVAATPLPVAATSCAQSNRMPLTSLARPTPLCPKLALLALTFRVWDVNRRPIPRGREPICGSSGDWDSSRRNLRIGATWAFLVRAAILQLSRSQVEAGRHDGAGLHGHDAYRLELMPRPLIITLVHQMPRKRYIAASRSLIQHAVVFVGHMAILERGAAPRIRGAAFRALKPPANPIPT